MDALPRMNPPGKPIQFGVRTLFSVTALAAVISMIALHMGIGWAVLFVWFALTVAAHFVASPKTWPRRKREALLLGLWAIFLLGIGGSLPLLPTVPSMENDASSACKTSGTGVLPQMQGSVMPSKGK